jgi:hypothetical protein
MITIAWDVDDVLNNLTEAWLTENHPEAAYEALVTNPPLEPLRLERGDYLASLDRFRATRFDALLPNAEVLAWFREHGHRARHVALSAVPRRFAPVSAEWTLTHFGDWIRTFSFIPSPRPDDAFPPYDPEKGAFLARTDFADALVDDNEKNILDARRLGLADLLFPQPWNSARDTPARDLLNSLTLLVSA